MHSIFCRKKVKKDHNYSLIMNRSQLTTTDDEEDFMDDDDFIEGIDEYLDGDDNLDGSSNIVINTGKFYKRYYIDSLPAAQYIHLNEQLNEVSQTLIFRIPLICKSDLEV